MKKLLILLALTLAGIPLAQAQNSFTISMNGANERPTPNASTATGSGTITLDGSNRLTFNISFSGLTTNVTGAHIHGPGNSNQAVAVIYDLITTGNESSTGTSGTITGLMQLTNPTQSGFAETVAAQEIDLRNSLWYINIHTSNNPGGEIRGQITPVPEPATLALASLGAAGLIGLFRRWKK